MLETKQPYLELIELLKSVFFDSIASDQDNKHLIKETWNEFLRMNK